MLLIFEIANNHNGDVNRGIEIIDNIPSGDYAIKLQFRHLETFIHPEFIDSDNKYVRRFLDTALTDDEYITLCDRIKDRGFRLVITPFDEISVEFAVNCGADILKVASCSALEWSLHEEICNYELPVIVSTAGLQISDIDKIVSFYKHKNIDLSLLHCVAEYPTDFDKLNMNFIDRLKSRYDLPIGYSGHEQPENFIPTIIALSKGACIIERHVGLDPLNAYSLDVENIAEFIHVVNESIKTCGEYEKEINMNEVNTLNKLRRGVYAFEGNKKGEKIEEFYFAFPLQDGCMSVQDFTRYRAEYDASRNYLADEPIVEHTPIEKGLDEIRSYVHYFTGMIHEAGINIGRAYTAELSHHYGIDKFIKTGAFIISLINREYCKKLICMLPRQNHPEHTHKRKEETFHVLYGDLTLYIHDTEHELNAGDIFTVERFNPHAFSTKFGVIFEEISTTHINGDSYYTDESIHNKDPMERKTKIEKL